MTKNYLRYYREKEHISRNELSKITNISLSAIIAYENGQRDLYKARYYIIEELCKTFGISHDYLWKLPSIATYNK